MLLITFATLLCLTARANMGLAAVTNLTLSALYGNPDLVKQGLISAWSSCVPDTSVKVSSPFYPNASADALWRFEKAAVHINSTLFTENFADYLHEAWRDIATKYTQFAEPMQSSLERTWDGHQELCPNLAQVDPFIKAMINRGRKIKECLEQVQSNTTWMSAPCLHGLLQDLRNQSLLWTPPSSTALDYQVAMPFYEQWAADHAVLSVAELRSRRAKYMVECEATENQTEACTDARNIFRESLHNFRSFPLRQLATVRSAVSRLYAIDLEDWRMDPEPGVPYLTSQCRLLTYNNGKGKVCDETLSLPVNQKEAKCTYQVNDEDNCTLAIQHEIRFDEVAYVCARALIRIRGYHQHPVQHAVAATYSKSLEPFVFLQEDLWKIARGWYRSVSQEVRSWRVGSVER